MLVVSIIVPVFNAADYLDDAIESILNQTYRPLELVFFDDASRDNSLKLLEEFAGKRVSDDHRLHGITRIVGKSLDNRGPGGARNQEVRLSSGAILCHFDADDIMHPDRVSEQIHLYMSLPESERDWYLIGTGFDRTPLDSTPYYTEWLNNLCTSEELHLHQYRECTIVCPTWLYSRALFDRIAAHRSSTDSGAFVQSTQDTLTAEGISRVPEDLYFFLDHLYLGGKLCRVPKTLLTYRYSPGGWTLGSKKTDLQKVRARYLERMVLSKWTSFQIWGYGKDGRKFLKFLSIETASRVSSFLDVDPNKVKLDYYYCKETKKRIPIRLFKDSTGDPIIICTASKRTNGELEANISTLGLREGLDYYHFA